MTIEERLRRELPALADALLDTGTAPAARPDDAAEIDFELDLRPRTEEHTMTKTRWLIAGVAAALTLLAVGVVSLSDDDDPGLDTATTSDDAAQPVAADTTSTTTTTTTTVPPAVLEVAEQIRGDFDARAAAFAAPTSDPDGSRFAETAVGGWLGGLLANVQGLHDDGRAIRPGDEGLYDLRIGSVVIDTSEASAIACEVNDRVLYEVATGTVVNDDVVTREYEIFLVLEDGVWKLSDGGVAEQWDGVAGCALSPDDYPL